MIVSSSSILNLGWTFSMHRLAGFRALVEENVKMSVQRIVASEIIRKVLTHNPNRAPWP